MSGARAPILEAMLRKADQKLEAARRALGAGDWDDASSRAYYAAFHAVSAELRQQGAVYTSHGQTLGAFNRDFVATGRFPKDTTRVLTRLFKDRQLGDYEVLVTVEAETAQPEVEDAGQLVQFCRELVNRSAPL